MLVRGSSKLPKDIEGMALQNLVGLLLIAGLAWGMGRLIGERV
jgi:hypothetical protein